MRACLLGEGGASPAALAGKSKTGVSEMTEVAVSTESAGDTGLLGVRVLVGDGVLDLVSGVRSGAVSDVRDVKRVVDLTL